MEQAIYGDDPGFDTHGLPEDVFDVAEANLPPQDIVKIYQNQIKGIPIPDPIEIRQLAEFIQNGNNAEDILATTDFAEIPREDEVLQIEAIAEAGQIALERLVVGHLRFAAHVARLTMGWVPWGSSDYKRSGESVFSGARIRDLSRFASAPLPLADRIQLANIALRKAAKIYKPEGGATFTTYAMHWIEQEIARGIAYDRNIKVPINVLEALARTAINPDTLSTTTFPGVKVIGWSDEDPFTRRRYIKEISTPISLEKLESESKLGAEDNDDSPSFYETIGEGYRNHSESDIVEIVSLNLKKSTVRKALDTLPERERRILELRYGIEGEPWTPEDIGHELDLTRERVRQLESQALSRLSGLRLLKNIADL